MDSLRHDSQLFAKIAGGSRVMRTVRHARSMVSALHVEMKLWSAGAPPEKAIQMPEDWMINEAGHNAWTAMSLGASQAAGIGCPYAEADRGRLIGSLRAALRANDYAVDPILAYDEWLLGVLSKLREQALLRHELAGPMVFADPNDKSPELVTIGQAQELVNTFVKHETCWQSAGMWVKQGDRRKFRRHAPEYPLGGVVYALHAPINEALLESLTQFELGRHLIRLNLLKKDENGVWIRAADVVPWCRWHQVDSLSIYYAIELILRQLAMPSWPLEMQDGLLNRCIGTIAIPILGIQGEAEPDWWAAVNGLPRDVFYKTLNELEHIESLDVAMSKVKVRDRQIRARIRNILDI